MRSVTPQPRRENFGRIQGGRKQKKFQLHENAQILKHPLLNPEQSHCKFGQH